MPSMGGKPRSAQRSTVGRAWSDVPGYPLASTEPDKLGFIVLRHVNSARTNEYWIESCRRIRRHYPTNKILVIDDDSDREHLKETQLDNVRVIESEYPRRAEMLPYYYYLHNREFDRAVILNDSAFLNAPLAIPDVPHCALWSAPENYADQAMSLPKKAFGPERVAALSAMAVTDGWRSCFACMAAITHDCLKDLNDRYPLDLFLQPLWDSRCPARTARMHFEQTMGCMLQSIVPCPRSLFGDIHDWCKMEGVEYGGIAFEDLKAHPTPPLVKVWTGR